MKGKRTSTTNIKIRTFLLPYWFIVLNFDVNSDAILWSPFTFFENSFTLFIVSKEKWELYSLILDEFYAIGINNLLTKGLIK